MWSPGFVAVAHCQSPGSPQAQVFTRQAITKHLRVMEKAGLVQCTHRGRESIWQLDKRRLNEVRDHLEQISRQWDDALERLRATVEDSR